MSPSNGECTKKIRVCERLVLMLGVKGDGKLTLITVF
jgi:hypothetical protein